MTVSTGADWALSMGRIDVVGAHRRVMGVRILAAVRDLDPPAGGAEMSLATLLKGVVQKGPYIEDAPDYTPLEGVLADEDASGWSVKIFQSSMRGDVTELTQASGLEREVCNLPVEDLWSGLSWRLRNRNTGRNRAGLERRHLLKTNRAFWKWLKPRLISEKENAEENGDLLIGVTQLHWSAGAARAFSNVGIPYLAFVRDELQFNHPRIYRDSLEGAGAVCGAGKGLLKQIQGVFKLQYGAHVPLPVNYTERFGSVEDVEKRRFAGLAERVERNDGGVPRIAIVGVTPEKGFGFYKQLLPHLQDVWPDAHVDVYGGGSYAEALDDFENATWWGHTSVEDVFSHCDVNVLTVASTGSWGRVINEAGLFGVPSVTVDIGSQSEAVGLGGIAVPKDGGLDAWVTALKEVYENREEYGLAAKKHCAVVDHRRSVAMFRSTIRDVLNL
jgi:glycosyltransferase involved in cell wall biosynthesis